MTDDVDTTKAIARIMERLEDLEDSFEAFSARYEHGESGEKAIPWEDAKKSLELLAAAEEMLKGGEHGGDCELNSRCCAQHLQASNLRINRLLRAVKAIKGDIPKSCQINVEPRALENNKLIELEKWQYDAQARESKFVSALWMAYNWLENPYGNDKDMIVASDYASLIDTIKTALSQGIAEGLPFPDKGSGRMDILKERQERINQLLHGLRKIRENGDSRLVPYLPMIAANTMEPPKWDHLTPQIVKDYLDKPFDEPWPYQYKCHKDPNA